MNEHEDIVIDDEELCAYVAEKTKVDAETVSAILEKEMDYLDDKGLLLPEKPQDDSTSGVFIDTDLLTKHIVNSLQVPWETVAAVLDAENSFLFDKGVLSVKYSIED